MRHRKIKHRLMTVAFLLLIFVGVFFVVTITQDLDNKAKGNNGIAKKETIVLWYSDEALTDYLNNKALAFYEKTDIRVEPKLVSGLEYLEEINRASVNVNAQDDAQQVEAPDVYLLTNDSLEKAYLAGLAVEFPADGLVSDQTLFNDAARNAVTYNGKYIACPLYFETSALLYNKTYLEQIVQKENEANMLAATTENPEGAPASENQETQVAEVVELTSDDLIPSSIVDILAFADKYSAPENVEYFFRWDVSDILYNYFFIGNYISVGGECGDDATNVNIYNTESIASMKVYQELNQFFSIDAKETNYDTIMQEFLEGKTIYTIATSDCMNKLDKAIADGEFAYEYGVASLPDINQELVTKGMSVTTALAVNGYSKHKEAANDFIAYLVREASCDLYTMTGKVSAVNQTSYSNAYEEAFVKNYAESISMPKLIETSNFWVELEICLAKVWNGEDANGQLRALSEKMKTQLAGEAVVEEILEDPDVELLSAVSYEENVD